MSRFSERSSGFSGNADRPSALPLSQFFEEALSELILPSALREGVPSRRTLFWGDEAEAFASFVAGWMALEGFWVIVLDGANRFDPYRVSLVARRASIPPERVLKGIQVARAFTSYQMETLIVEKLPQLLEKPSQRPWVILLGAVTPFGDEDLSDGEAGLLFERILRKMKELSSKGIPLLLFQSSFGSRARSASLMKKLFSFSDRVWKMAFEAERPKWVLQKGWAQPMGAARPKLPLSGILSTEGDHG